MSNGLNKVISVIIPMYNESAIIKDTALTLHKYMSERFGKGNFEIIFSNDGSVDGCDEIVKNLNLDGVTVIGYKNNQGKGCAVRKGFLAANGEYVMFTDADLAYGTEVIGRVYETFKKNPQAEIIIGSRNLTKDGYKEYTLLRKMMSKAYIKVLCIIGGFNLTDSQCGCKAFRGDACKKIFSRCRVNGFAFDFEAILWAEKLGMKIIEMPVKIINHRESKVNVFKDTFKMLNDIKEIKKRVKRQKI